MSRHLPTPSIEYIGPEWTWECGSCGEWGDVHAYASDRDKEARKHRCPHSKAEIQLALVEVLAAALDCPINKLDYKKVRKLSPAAAQILYGDLG